MLTIVLRSTILVYLYRKHEQKSLHISQVEKHDQQQWYCCPLKGGNDSSIFIMGKKDHVACWFQCCWKTQLVSFDRSNNTGAMDVKMDGSVLEEKSSFKMLGLTLSSKLDWGSYIISIAKTTSKKIGALIRSKKFLSPEVALSLFKSTIRPCMEYCCHVWAGAPSCYLELLDKLQKRICRTIGPSLAASLEPLSHRRNVINLILFYRYYLSRCSLNWLNWFHFHFLEGGLLVILIDCMIFLSPFLDVKKMSMSTVSFLAQLDAEFSAYRNVSLFVLLFLVTPCPVVAVQPCMEWITLKKKKLWRND